MHKQLIQLAALSLTLVPAITVLDAGAAVITSSDFRMAYGASVTGTNAWNDVETVSQNSPTTQGAFRFSPAPVGQSFSAGGLITNADGTAANGVAEPTSVCGWLAPAVGFAVPITAQYLGAAPGDAASTPNYRLVLEITSLRIYASDTAEGSDAGGYMAWAETTSGHTQEDNWINTPLDVPYYNALSLYAPVTWNPADYSVVIGLNDSYTRTFGIRNATFGDDWRHGDALEVTGRVLLIYDAVPEPAALSLLALGGMVLFRRGRG
ncbi:MAG: PEP-CTERM sorting domain-containing protein [Lentisphaeria bacterium]